MTKGKKYKKKYLFVHARTAKAPLCASVLQRDRDWNIELINDLRRISCEIFQVNKVKPADSINIYSPAMLRFLEGLNDTKNGIDIFVYNREYSEDNRMIGRLAGRFDVYMVPATFKRDVIIEKRWSSSNKGEFDKKMANVIELYPFGMEESMAKIILTEFNEI